MKLVRKKLARHLLFLVYRRMNVFLHGLLFKDLKIEHPHIIEIEMTNDCNLKCKHCHRNAMKRPVGHMELEVFRKLVDEISQYPISFLRIVGLGEPSLNPHFRQMLQYASRKGIKIEIATNGELFERFSGSEILSWDIDIIGISIDGTDKSSYEKTRIGGKYDLLSQQIRDFYGFRTRSGAKYPLVVIRKVLLPADSEEEINGFVRTWKNTSDMITFNTLSKVNKHKEFDETSSIRCQEFYYTSHIRWDGSVILCPNKFIFDRNDTIGNIKYDKLREIWQSGELSEIRKQHKSKDYPDFCKRCHVAFDREKTYRNSRNHNFSNNRLINRINKYVNIS